MTEKIKVKGDDMVPINFYAYSVGHTINDITVTLLSNYLLYWLTEMILLSNFEAGLISLFGLVADASLVLVTGILVDKYGSSTLGKKTTWFALGNILSLLGIVFLFRISPFHYYGFSSVYDIIYYSASVIIYSFGYGLTNISHISLIPSLSINRKSKDYMVRLRTGFRFIAQLLAVILSSFFFYLITDKYLTYELQAMFSALLGISFSIFFFVFCREPVLGENLCKYYKEFKNLLKKQDHKLGSVTVEGTTNGIEDMETLCNEENRKNSTVELKEEDSFSFWLTYPLFYKYIVAYLMIHVSVNVTPSFIPYYMECVLEIKKTSTGGTPYEIAIFFLINTIGSIFSSLFLQNFIESYQSRFIGYFAAWLFTTVGCLPLIFLSNNNLFAIFILSFFIGIGFSLAINIGFIISNDVVGNRCSKGGFVYSVFGFVERVIVGFTILLFMEYVKDSYMLMRYMLPLLPVVLLSFGMIIVWLEETKNVSRENEDNDKLCELLLNNSNLTWENVR